VELTCTNCGARVGLPEETEGKRLRCAGCGQDIAAAAPPPAPPPREDRYQARTSALVIFIIPLTIIGVILYVAVGRRPAPRREVPSGPPVPPLPALLAEAPQGPIALWTQGDAYRAFFTRSEVRPWRDDVRESVLVLGTILGTPFVEISSGQFEVEEIQDRLKKRGYSPVNLESARTLGRNKLRILVERDRVIFGSEDLVTRALRVRWRTAESLLDSLGSDLRAAYAKTGRRSFLYLCTREEGPISISPACVATGDARGGRWSYMAAVSCRTPEEARRVRASRFDFSAQPGSLAVLRGEIEAPKLREIEPRTDEGDTAFASLASEWVRGSAAK
jgi:hypothetical protein